MRRLCVLCARRGQFVRSSPRRRGRSRRIPSTRCLRRIPRGARAHPLRATRWPLVSTGRHGRARLHCDSCRPARAPRAQRHGRRRGRWHDRAFRHPSSALGRGHAHHRRRFGRQPPRSRPRARRHGHPTLRSLRGSGRSCAPDRRTRSRCRSRSRRRLRDAQPRDRIRPPWRLRRSGR